MASTSHTGLLRTHGAPTRAAQSPHTASARLQHALSPVPSCAKPGGMTNVPPHPAPCHRWPQLAYDEPCWQPVRKRRESEYSTRTSTRSRSRLSNSKKSLANRRSSARARAAQRREHEGLHGPRFSPRTRSNMRKGQPCSRDCPDSYRIDVIMLAIAPPPPPRQGGPRGL